MYMEMPITQRNSNKRVHSKFTPLAICIVSAEKSVVKIRNYSFVRRDNVIFRASLKDILRLTENWPPISLNLFGASAKPFGPTAFPKNSASPFAKARKIGFYHNFRAQTRLRIGINDKLNRKNSQTDGRRKRIVYAR